MNKIAFLTGYLEKTALVGVNKARNMIEGALALKGHKYTPESLEVLSEMGPARKAFDAMSGGNANSKEALSALLQRMRLNTAGRGRGLTGKIRKGSDYAKAIDNQKINYTKTIKDSITDRKFGEMVGGAPSNTRDAILGDPSLLASLNRNVSPEQLIANKGRVKDAVAWGPNTDSGSNNYASDVVRQAFGG